MSFSVKDWKDDPDTTTPLSAAGMEDLETRLSGYTDTGIAALGTMSTQAASSVAITGGAITGITDLAVADGGTGSSSATGAATNLGLGTGDSPQFTAINVGAATDTTVTRASAGNINVEGNLVYRAGGTDVPVADGGTGSSTAGGALTNLGAASQTDFAALAGAYRTLYHGSVPGGKDITAGVYFVAANFATGAFPADNAGVLGATASPYLSTCRIIGADFPAITGLSKKLRVIGHVGSNGTDPNTDVTLGLYPVSGFTGAADEINVDLGTVVTGSTAPVTNANLGTNDSELATGSDFDLPTDGLYALGFATSATLANNSVLFLTVQLQMHYV